MTMSLGRREAFADKRPYPSTSGLVASILTDSGDDEDDWYFGDTPPRSSSGCEQPSMALPNIPGLVSRVPLPVHESKFYVLRLEECSINTCLAFNELRQVFKNEQVRAELRMDEVRWMKEQVHTDEGGSEGLAVARASVEEPAVERASFTAVTEQSEAERYT